MKAARQGQSDIDPTNMVQTGEHGAAAAEHLSVDQKAACLLQLKRLTCGSCSLPVFTVDASSEPGPGSRPAFPPVCQQGGVHDPSLQQR